MKVEMKSYKREPELASIIDSESISLVFCVKLACSDMHGEKKDVVGPQFQEWCCPSVAERSIWSQPYLGHPDPRKNKKVK